MDPTSNQPNMPPVTIPSVGSPLPHQVPQPTTPQQPIPVETKKKRKWLFVLIPVLLFIILGIVGFIYVIIRVNAAHQKALETVDNADLNGRIIATPSPSPTTEDGCIPLSLGLKNTKTTTALFLQETEKRGYEGIVRKIVDGDKKVSFDIVTNMLPDSGAPYAVWIAYPNANGKICGGAKLGPMTKEPTTKTWVISFDETSYKDDANVVIITSGNLDTSDGNLYSMDDPHVILRGFFGQTDHIDEIQ